MTTDNSLCSELDALGIPWKLLRCRGEECVFTAGHDEDYPGDESRFSELRVHRIVGGYPVSYHDRRRYSNKTFTWVYALVDGEWRSLGDPWPCITPPDRQVLEAIARTKNPVYAEGTR